MSAAADEPPITVENALIGLTLTQSFFSDDPDAEDLFEQITGRYDDDDLLRIYAQFATIWAITEAHAQGVTVPQYIRRLRARMLSTNTLLKEYNR